jgi:hypothetical protein
MRSLPRALACALIVASPAYAQASDEDEAPSTAIAAEAVPAQAPAASPFAGLEINVYANVAARADSNSIKVDGQEVTDRAYLREAELELRGPIVPGAEGVFIGTIESFTDPAELNVGVEAGYLHAAEPLFGERETFGVEGWLGRFRSSFGRANRYRLVDLPQVTRPLVVERYLGPNGYLSIGARGRLRFYGHEDESALFATVEVGNSNQVAATDPAVDAADAVVANLDWRQRLGDTVRMTAGVSGYRGKQGGGLIADAHLLGADWALSWERGEGGGLRSADVGVEWIRVLLERPGDGRIAPDGWTAFGQLQPLDQLYASLRYDSVQDLASASLETSRYGVYGTWVPDPKLRFQLAVERYRSDDVALDGATTVWLECNFAFGMSPRSAPWLRGVSR